MHLQSSHFQPVGPICIQTTDLSVVHVTAPRPSCRTGAAISLHNISTYKLQVKASSEFLDDGGAWLLDFEPPRVIMSPISPDDTSQRPSQPHDVQATYVDRINVFPDPFELFEGPHSDSSASDALRSGSGDFSSASSKRLDRLEGLLEGMAKQQAQFMANQVQLQERLQHRSEQSQIPPVERTYGGSSAFTDFMKARESRMRVSSLDAPMPTAPAASSPTRATRPEVYATNAEQPKEMQTPAQKKPMPSAPAEQFVPPVNFGLKIPKPRDLDWSGFAKFSGKVYPGLGADFKSWGLRFLQRLGAAQQMSGGDWPEEFRILALNGKLDGTALVYFERMLPMWTMESPTLEHVMNRMLVPYMTTITATKGLQLMTAEKLQSRTWTEHFQYLVYVAERSGCSELHVLLR
jgi:hypothetical protein